MAFFLGTSGRDNLVGTSGTDSLFGLEDNDVLDGAGGADFMAGGLGDDTYVVDDIGDVISELISAGTDTVIASVNYVLASNVENLTLTGAAPLMGRGNGLDNVITGNAARNDLFGDGGNDTLDGGLGADTMVGGTGNDTYWVDNVGDVVSELAGPGEGNWDIVHASINYTLGANLENLYLDSGARNGTGNDLDNRIYGNADKNVLVGGDGDDWLHGYEGSDRLEGGDGNDALSGGDGADTMIGGTGNDFYWVDNVGDMVTELAGQGTHDAVDSSITYKLGDNVEELYLSGTAAINGFGNKFDNQIEGNSQDNLLFGDDGNDKLAGGGGVDTLVGGLGDDIYTIYDSSDILVEQANQGIDTVRSDIDYTLQTNFENLTLLGYGNRITPPVNLNGVGNGADNVITGNAGLNVLNGLDGADTLYGGLGDDHLYGGIGNDTLRGEGDNDVLWGGYGVDVLIGGVGVDRFYFADVNDSGARGNGADEIVDFSAAEGDKIDISSIDANINTAGNQAFSFIGNNNNFFAAGQVRFNGGFVEGDVNGDLVADFRIHVNASTLVAADFVL